MSVFFFFNDTATTEISTLSLHDALPISRHLRDDPHAARLQRGRLLEDGAVPVGAEHPAEERRPADGAVRPLLDRKSTRLNSSHGYISYAVFCLKKKKKYDEDIEPA